MNQMQADFVIILDFAFIFVILLAFWTSLLHWSTKADNEELG